jgi:hypothetical protein
MVEEEDETTTSDVIPLKAKEALPEKEGKPYWFGYDLLFQEYDKSFLILLGL